MPSLKQLPSNSQYIRAKPVRKTTVPSLNFASSNDEFANSGLKTNFAARFEGYQPPCSFCLRLKPLSCRFLDIPEAGKWTFVLSSDDGSTLLLDGVKVQTAQALAAVDACPMR